MQRLPRLQPLNNATLFHYEIPRNRRKHLLIEQASSTHNHLGIPCPAGQAGIWQIKPAPTPRGALKNEHMKSTRPGVHPARMIIWGFHMANKNQPRHLGAH
jgi:hypothetical protein